MLLKCIGLILQQNKVLEELNMISQSSFNSRNLFNLSCKYTNLSLGFNWILRLRCGYKYNTTIAIGSCRVTENCPKCCPCCGQGDQSFIHWIFECSTFSHFRLKSLGFHQ